MNDNLLILGAGQYGAVVKETAAAMGCFQRIAFLDDCFGTESAGYHGECIGKIEEYERFAKDFSYAIPSVGDAELRRRWTEMLKGAGYRIPVLVSPRAYVSPSAQLGEGCVIEPLAGVHANAVVGAGTLVSMGAVLDHNSFVMDFCHIGCGAAVMSGAAVGSGERVPSGSTVAGRDAKEAAAFILSSLQNRHVGGAGKKAGD